ncbi:wings apart-like protein regulation of heterochromatin-domain-containing protein [Tuber brumale]|nr:wings apart-like protein regulation of heterochromatin-domain-containing protein [Tuber brumale]
MGGSVLVANPVQQEQHQPQQRKSSSGMNGKSTFAKAYLRTITPPAPPTQSSKELAAKKLDSADIFDFEVSSDVEEVPVVPTRKGGRGLMKTKKQPTITRPTAVAGFGVPSTESDIPERKIALSKKRSYKKGGGVTVPEPKRRKSLKDSDEEMVLSVAKGKGAVSAALPKGKKDLKGDKITSTAKVTKNSTVLKVTKHSTFEVSIPYTLDGQPSAKPALSKSIVKSEAHFLTKKQEQERRLKPLVGPGSAPDLIEKKGAPREKVREPLPKPTAEKEPAKKSCKTTLKTIAASRVQKTVPAMLPGLKVMHGSLEPLMLAREGSAGPNISAPVNKKVGKKVKAKAAPRGTKRLSEELSDGDEFDIPLIAELRPVRRRRLIDTLGGDTRGSRAGTRSTSVTTDSSGDGDSFTQDAQYAQFQQLSGSQNGSSQPQDLFQFGSQGQKPPTLKPTYTTGRIGPKVTYAQQRSFKADENMSEQNLFGIPLMMMPSPYSGKTGVNFDEGLEEEPLATAKGMMKNIHELRETGSNNRFLDDVEDFFGDIEGKNVPLGTKRSGYIGLACKMVDKTFVRNFRANNFDTRLLKRVAKQTDEVICFALAFMIARLLWEDSTVQILSEIHTNGALDMLVRMLDFERDIKVVSKDKKTNMSKAAQGMAMELRTLVDKSTVFPQSKPTVYSAQIMGLMVLETVIRKLRAAGIHDRIVSLDVLGKLVTMVKLFITPTKAGKALDMLVLELLVSALEAWACGLDVEIETAFSKDELTTLTDIIPTIISQAVTGDNGKFHVGDFDVKDILLLTLRLNINMTNDRIEACDALASSDLIPILIELISSRFCILDGQLGEVPRLVNLDLLVLGLGLLNNFAEMSIPGRCSVLRRDETGVRLLDILVRLFLARFSKTEDADSLEESQSNVGFGYLAILLGNLCQDTEIRIAIRNQLPNKSLNILYESMEVFIAHHRKVDELKDESDIFYQLGEAHCAFTERLERVVRRLKEGY